MKMHLIFEQIFIFEIKNSLADNWEIDNLIILLIFIKIINYIKGDSRAIIEKKSHKFIKKFF